MFDIGWPEFFVLLVVALLVLGPRDLPKALYQVGKWVKAARKVTREFQRHVDDMVRDTELEEVKKGVQAAKSFSVKKQVENMIDPDGDLGGDRATNRPASPAASPTAAASTAAAASAEPGDPKPSTDGGEQASHPLPSQASEPMQTPKPTPSHPSSNVA